MIDDITGILANICIISGFCFKDVRWIRLLNLIGSVMFLIYGLLVGALYTWIANLIMIFVNGYYLTKIHREKERIDDVR